MRLCFRRFLCSACLMIASALGAVVSAQHFYSPNLAIGVKGGMTLSNMQFSPSVEQGMLQGKLIGVAVRYTEEKLFGLIGEVNLEQRGWKEKFEDNPEFEYSRTLTYLQVPILTHIYFGGKNVKCFVNLGPSVGYMLSNSISSNFDYTNPTSVPGFPLQYRTTEQMKMEVSKKFDYGITGGIGVEFRIRRRHHLQLEGRYYFGLGNIFPDRKKDYFAASRGTSIQVTLGYLFRIK